MEIKLELDGSARSFNPNFCRLEHVATDALYRDWCGFLLWRYVFCARETRRMTVAFVSMA
jgi:hypothetical protein